jgi:hypothetical protein
MKYSTEDGEIHVLDLGLQASGLKRRRKNNKTVYI